MSDWVPMHALLCSHEVTEEKKTSFEDHARYHHALHGTCEFCLELFSIFPTFNFSRLIKSGSFYSPVYESVKSYVFTHRFTIKKLDKEARLRCQLCDKVFTKISDKKRHVQLAHYEQTFPCNICGKEFTRRDSVARHFQMVHSDKKPTFQCEVCGSKFVRETDLKRHFTKFHGEGKVAQYSCDKCDEIFYTPSGLVVHTRREHRRFHCDLCGKKFATKFNFDNHLKLKNPCEFCDVETCTKVRMDAHMKSAHSNQVHFKKEGNYECEVCSKSYSNENALLYHKKVKHEVSSTKTPCYLCGKQFSSEKSMQRHSLIVHVESDVSKDIVCESKFSRKDALARHEKEQHGSKVKFDYVEHVEDMESLSSVKCELCAKTFRRKSDLKRHTGSIHSETPKEFNCNLCGKTFSRNSTLNRHMKSTHTEELA